MRILNIETARNRNKKIRPVVFTFLFFELTMLFQTNYLKLGTIISAIIVGMILVTLFLRRPKIYVSIYGLAIFFYAVLLFLNSMLKSTESRFLYQVILYIFLFLCLSSIDLNEREKTLLMNGYVFASIVYSFLIIYSRFTNASSYVHSKIPLFGTELDPNYVGLPLVISFSIVLFNYLNKSNDKKAARVFELLIILFAILLTSSRGSFIALVVCVILNYLFFVREKNMAWYKKVFLFILIIVFFVSFYNFANAHYSNFLGRLFNFAGDDVSNGRIELWNKAISLWLERPIFGNGYEGFGIRYAIGVHNTFIQVLCDTGLVGFVLFFTFLFFLGKKCYVNNKLLFIAFVVLLSHSFFLGAMSSRCFWASLIMIGMILPSNNIKYNEEL